MKGAEESSRIRDVNIIKEGVWILNFIRKIA
jgi:hypothetical protein